MHFKMTRCPTIHIHTATNNTSAKQGGRNITQNKSATNTKQQKAYPNISKPSRDPCT